jgi:hypothetical protein
VAELKTKQTKASVQAFLRGIDDEEKRRDSQILARLMRQATGSAPRMWGPGIIGFGSTTYRYPSGRELDWFPVGFSPRKNALTLYLMGGLKPNAALLRKLGKHTTGKGCLYIKRLEDVDLGVLEQVIRESVRAAGAASKRP